MLGKKCLIRSDHKSLTYLQKFKEPEGILAPWINILGAYEFDIQYREGTKHLNADSLTRRIKRPCKIVKCQECINTSKQSAITDTIV